MTTTQSSKDKLQSITDKRKALESLIHIASGVENQHSALNELALAARPSQEFPAKVVSYFNAMEKSLADQDSTGLLQKLEKVELAIGNSIEKILGLAKLDINKLRDNEIENIDVSVFKKFIEEFKRRTNTSLGLRLILKKRGLAIAPIQIPIKQEAINEQIEALKEKEKRCVKQIRSEIQSIIKDTQQLLKSENIPEVMREELNSITKAMQVNIEHLDRGGSVCKIPNVFEVIVLESTKSDTLASDSAKTEPKNGAAEIEKNSAQSAKNVESNKAEKEAIPSSKSPKKSNWWIFKKWLSSPWKTSWKSLKQKYGKSD